MTSFLVLVARIYKYGFLFVVAATIIMMVVGSDSAAVTMGKGFSALAYPFILMFDYVVLPLMKLVQIPTDYVNNIPYEEQQEMGGFAYVVMLGTTAIFFLGGVLTIFIYSIVMFLIFPIWTIVDEEMAGVWAMYLNPLYIVGEAVIPLMAEINNSAQMNSSDPVIRQMAINDDLADRITGKMATKQDVVDGITNRTRSVAGVRMSVKTQLKTNISDLKWF